MKIYWKINLIGVILLLFASCSESKVDFGEQYKKTLYIVNSRGMLYTGEHAFGAENNTMDFSVYCASSKPIDGAVKVTLKLDSYALDSLNKKNALGNPLYVDIMLLPETNYQLEDPTVVIGKHEQYGVLKVKFNMDGLNPDLRYALPFSIVSNDADFEVNPELRTMVYEVKSINGYSGDYSGNSTELPNTIRAAQPKLQALSSNTVRMPIHTLSSEAVKDLDTNFMVLTIAEDSTTVSIKPWANAKVTDLGDSSYDKKRQSFVLNYSFMNSDGKILNIKEKITNLNAPPIEDDEEIEE